MKHIIVLTTLLVILTTFSCAYNEIDLVECNNPKSQTISGQVLDYYTKEPVSDALIDLRDNTFGSPDQPVVISDQNGEFAYEANGCAFTDNLIRLDGASHSDYGSSHLSQRSNSPIYLYRCVDVSIRLIERDTSVIDNITVHYGWTIDEVDHSWGNFGTSTEKPILTNKKLPENISLKIDYTIGTQERQNLGTFLLQEDTELVLEYD